MIDNVEWAEKTFGEANLGDPRRTSRLVKLAATLANTPGKPLVNITESPADMEGAYRFIRNESVDATSIAETGFNVTAGQAERHKTLLALEDTTTISPGSNKATCRVSVSIRVGRIPNSVTAAQD